MEKKMVYKCNKCGNIVEALWSGKVPVKCCNEKMEQLALNSVDAAVEKHVPVIEREGNQVRVKVGANPHPMTPEHYILFVELLAGNKVYRHDFSEGDTVAEAAFLIEEKEVEARAYCNLHGFWVSA